MRILHIFDPSMDPAGARMRRAEALIEAQGRLGFTVYRQTLPPRLGRRTAWARISAALCAFAEMREVRREIAATRAHILHAHHTEVSARAAIRAARWSALPVVFDSAMAAPAGEEPKNDASFKFWARIFRHARLWTPVWARADAVLASTVADITNLRAAGVDPQRVHIAPTPIDESVATRPTLRDEALATLLGVADKTVLFYGGAPRVGPAFWDLLEAIIARRARGVELTLLLTPSGERTEEWRELRDEAKHGLGGGLICLERDTEPIDATEFAPELLADLYCAPDDAPELLEIAVPAAMAAGSLILAPETAETTGLLSDGETGWLFRARNREALSDGLERALAARNRWPQMRAAARAQILTVRGGLAIAEKSRKIYAAARRQALSRRWRRR